MKQPQQKRLKHHLHGWLNLDKPYDMTSTQAVTAIKKLMSPAKIGHAGTLDPLATGVLPLALGEATKTVQYLMEARKEYVFTVRFGVQTDTDDAEGMVIKESAMRPTDAAINAILPHYTGVIEQLPPTYSALKINGERAYDLARAGEEVVLATRPVVVHRFTMRERVDADHAIFHVECGKGTYVRSLARDIAASLGTCAHISSLRRTRVGSFFESDAISLDVLEKSVIGSTPDSYQEFLYPTERALDDIPAVMLDGTQAQRLRHGNHCYVSPAAFREGNAVVAGEDALYQAWCNGQFFALVARRERALVPLRIFNTHT
jgi:tRNA pseudouridine55 synthase